MTRAIVLGGAAAAAAVVLAGSAVSAAKLTLTSSAFANGAAIPAKHTCDGTGLSPALRWSGAPAGTKAFAILLDDPDAPGGTFTHWITWNIAGTAKGLAAGRSGPGVGANDAAKRGYAGPCPPEGTTHRYVFHLYALRAKLALRQGASRAQFIAAIKGKMLAQAQLLGRFARAASPPEPFTLTSSAFAEGGPIPQKHACTPLGGQNASPPLVWHGTPAGTKEIALKVDDPDAGGFVHWITWGIASTAGSLGEGSGGTVSGRSHAGAAGYFGPCPPRPDGPHRYVFHLYALKVPLTLAQGATPAAFDAAIAGQVLGEAKLTGTFDA